jgi:Na+/glutamate symporter
MSVIAQGMMIVGKPKDSFRDNAIDLFIEVCVSLYLYILLVLTDWWGTNDLREELGWVLVILVIVTMLINFLNFTYGSIKSGIKRFKKKCMKKTKKQVEKPKEDA